MSLLRTSLRAVTVHRQLLSPRSFGCRRALASVAPELANRKYVRYDSVVPEVPDTEAADTQSMKDMFTKIIDMDNEAHGHTFPTTHSRTLAIVKGKLIIPDELPKHLQQGPFAKGGEYEVAMRYSIASHDVAMDPRVILGRGMAIKIFNMPGERFPEGIGNTTQDFMFNSQVPVSELADARTSKELIMILIKALKDPKGAQEDMMKRRDLALQMKSGRQPKRHVPAMEFYSQFAYRFGDYVAKHGMFPNTEAQKKLVDVTIPPEGTTSAYLSTWIKDFFAENDVEYEWRFQLLENTDEQSVEYAGTEWDPEKFPYQTLGRLVFPKQDSYDYELRAFWENSMRLNAWRGLQVFEPLGGSNRARRAIYPMSRSQREHLNGSKFRDVQKLEELPGPIPEGAKVATGGWFK